MMQDSADFTQLTAALRGDVIPPNQPGYDAARSVWNAMIDRRPDLIVRCRGAADVQAVMRFAAQRGMPVAVKGGGHNIAGTAVADGGLLIDLSLMRGVHIEPKQRLAMVEGGALLSDLDRESQAYGLATPAGVVSSTGVGGLALGGGFGWLSRKHGLTADNLIAADLVTPAGEQVTVDAESDPELLWGLRGGGGNFGVVTRFTFRLHQVGPQVMFGPTIWRLEDAPAVLRHYGEIAPHLPREACVWADLATAPPLPFLDERHHGEKVLILMQFHAGEAAEAETALAPLRNFGAPIGDAVGPTDYVEAQSRLDDVYEKGARNYWRAFNLHALSDPLPSRLATAAAAMPTPQSDILICLLGGAVAEANPAAAYPHRDAMFSITPGARWMSADDDQMCLDWIKTAFEPIASMAKPGAYVNFIAESAGRERDAYGASYARLAALKARLDPHNRLRSNQNIRPTAS
ncbi:MAG: FAD-binding oxidoreductase [Rhodobacteraceae bacterium]|nr:FAD-binding oxidoreductase [Paracoccaceae bacterium]